MIQHSARRAHRLGVRLGSSASLGERGVRSEGIQRVADEEVLVGVGIAIFSDTKVCPPPFRRRVVVRIWTRCRGTCVLQLSWSSGCSLRPIIGIAEENAFIVNARVDKVKCHKSTALIRNWADGSTLSIHASKLANWIRNEKGCSTKFAISSMPRFRRTRKAGICSSRSCMIIMKDVVTVSCFGLSTLLPSS
jgi:hypothetical protein